MSSFLIRYGGWALVLSGLLWAASYGVDVVVGSQTGQTAAADGPFSSGAALLASAFGNAGIFFIGLGLVGVRARLRGRSKWLRRAGLLLALPVVAAAAVNLVLFAVAPVSLTSESRSLSAVGILGANLGATLLGAAALRAGALPRRAAILLTISLPMYLVTNFPFPVVGALWAAAGHALLTDVAGVESESARSRVAA